MNTFKIIPSGDSALLCKFSDNIHQEHSDNVFLLNKSIKAELPSGVLETVPSYSALMVYFDPLRIAYHELKELIINRFALALKDKRLDKSRRIISVPVCYGGSFGPDLEMIAEKTGLDSTTIIDIHSSKEYFIYMLGFSPGFPYLGGLDERIAFARKSKPRLQIDAGSVGIAGTQTGIYSIDSPGGWQIIGKTPLKLFDAKSKSPFLFKAGDYLKFEAISSDEYSEILESISTGSFSAKIRTEL